jgi:hypothetical protein
MGITEDATIEELRVDANQTLWIYSAAHIIDVGFPGSLESSVIASAESVENPSKLVLYGQIRHRVRAGIAHSTYLGMCQGIPDRLYSRHLMCYPVLKRRLRMRVVVVGVSPSLAAAPLDPGISIFRGLDCIFLGNGQRRSRGRLPTCMVG